MRLVLLTPVLATALTALVSLAGEVDPASAIRGSLGASLDDLSVDSPVGVLSLVLNGGFALLFAVFACVAVAGGRRDRTHRPGFRARFAARF